MALEELVMPKMGESIIEGTILRWLKKPGEIIAQDESVLEVATDKVDTEVPSLHAGVLKDILAKEGDIVPVGTPIARIETKDRASKALSSKRSPAPIPQADTQKEEDIPAVALPTAAKSTRFYSPLVRSIARREGISLATLEGLSGSGKEGRLTRDDMLAYLEKGGEKRREGKGAGVQETTALPVQKGEDEVVEMNRMRMLISERMVASKRISPHVTSFVEADVTELVQWRQRVKTPFYEKYGESMTLTPFFVEATCKALLDFPDVNVSVDKNRILRHKAIHIGIAVALPTQNLIVPVIKHANELSLIGLAKRINELARKARSNQLSPQDIEGGTYTVSNVGSFGNVMGTPIILQPQVGILAFGIVRKKPAVITTPQGDAIAIRHMMFLSHSYDHRVIDGALGGSFVRRVADHLENFDTAQQIGT